MFCLCQCWNFITYFLVKPGYKSWLVHIYLIIAPQCTSIKYDKSSSKTSKWSHVSNFGRPRIVAYQDVGLTYREINGRIICSAMMGMDVCLV